MEAATPTAAPDGPAPEANEPTLAGAPDRTGADEDAIPEPPAAPRAGEPAGEGSTGNDALLQLGLGVILVVAGSGFAAALGGRVGVPAPIAGGVAALGLTAALLAAVKSLVERAARGPLQRLRAALEEIEEGNYDVRLDPEGPREMQELALGFNRMATIVGHQRERLKALAATDPLTGLANQRMFHERLRDHLKRAAKAASPLAVVIVDIDDFKRVNETFGHARGDELLQTVATELREAVRSTDLVARVGGDDFGIILPGADADFARQVADRAIAAVECALPAEELSASAGFACHPADAAGETMLDELAASALNVAKRRGGKQVMRYDAAQAAALPTLREQHAEVTAILARPDGISPAFQPIVELTTGRITGYEALTRFSGSKRSPDAWFKQAARAGLGPQLEAAAIRAAFEIDSRPADTYLSLNFSPSALASRQVTSLLPRDLSDVVVEITEHELAQDDGTLEASLTMMRRRGARIAVDDAGAGYAGLKQVMRIQPDIIKLDRGILERVDVEPAKAALVRFFLLFAGRVGAAVCGEGLETPSEIRAVMELGVVLGQGYALGRPGPPWPEVPRQMAKALVTGSLRRSQEGGRPVASPINRRLERYHQQLAEANSNRWRRSA